MSSYIIDFWYSMFFSNLDITFIVIGVPLLGIILYAWLQSFFPSNIREREYEKESTK